MIDYPEDELWFHDVVPDPEDDENIPPEHLIAAEDYGVTADEERHPEPLTAHLRRELPEPRTDPDDDAAAEALDDPETVAERAIIDGLFERRHAHG